MYAKYLIHFLPHSDCFFQSKRGRWKSEAVLHHPQSKYLISIAQIKFSPAKFSYFSRFNLRAPRRIRLPIRSLLKLYYILY